MKRRIESCEASTARVAERGAPEGMLFAYPIYCSETYRFHEYIADAILELDEATGRHITLLDINTPEICGPNHDELRSAWLKKQDAKDADWYVDRILNRGLDKHHRLSEMREYRRSFGIGGEHAACIVFMSRTSLGPVGILPLESRLVQDVRAINAFDSRLRDLLMREDVVRIALAILSDTEIAAGLAPLLKDASWEINSAVRAAGSYWRPSSTRPAMLPTARLVIDPWQGTVFYGGHQLQLTPTPSRLVGVLAESPGQGVDRDVLFKKVIGGSAFTTTNVEKWTRNHVSAIRRALRECALNHGLAQEDVDGLISTRLGRITLNLSREEVYIQGTN